MTSNYKKYFVPALFTLVFGSITLAVEPFRFGDFEVFMEAGKNLAAGKNIYLSNANGFKYFYSPLFATLLSFLNAFPDIVAVSIWKLFNLVFLLRFWVLLEKMYIDYTGFSQRQQYIYQFTVFAVSFFLLFSCFHLVQMSVFLLWAVFECLYQLQVKKRPIPGAAVLAFAINVKIMPVVILPYLLYRKQYMATLYVLVWTVIFLYLPILFIGFHYNVFLHEEWFKSINPTNAIHVLDLDETGFHSLTSFLQRCYQKGMEPIGTLTQNATLPTLIRKPFHGLLMGPG
ncbi:MAG TPA: glycosyltransferase family 87 protein [Flavobacteriales bacterium]|nr:glycosyltransferase family 87 protein [Flavobacteriales bacterium]